MRESIERENPDRFKKLKKPQLYPKFELNFDPKHLDGDKKYYSNGEIEKIITNENGKKVTYSFSTNGELSSIEKDNIKIHYSQGDISQIIEENLGNGKSKESIYNLDGTTRCTLKDNGKEQYYYFDKNGNISGYHQFEEV